MRGEVRGEMVLSKAVGGGGGGRGRAAGVHRGVDRLSVSVLLLLQRGFFTGKIEKLVIAVVYVLFGAFISLNYKHFGSLRLMKAISLWIILNK